MYNGQSNSTASVIINNLILICGAFLQLLYRFPQPNNFLQPKHVHQRILKKDKTFLRTVFSLSVSSNNDNAAYIGSKTWVDLGWRKKIWKSVDLDVEQIYGPLLKIEQIQLQTFLARHCRFHLQVRPFSLQLCRLCSRCWLLLSLASSCLHRLQACIPAT